ncbi:hypothetical protein PV325_004089, partial [Microctonus aethiopoides]
VNLSNNCKDILPSTRYNPWHWCGIETKVKLIQLTVSRKFQHVIILLYIDKIVESGLNYGQQQALDLCLYILRKEPYKHVVDEDDKHLILVLHPIMVYFSCGTIQVEKIPIASSMCLCWRIGEPEMVEVVGEDDGG